MKFINPVFNNNLNRFYVKTARNLDTVTEDTYRVRDSQLTSNHKNAKVKLLINKRKRRDN